MTPDVRVVRGEPDDDELAALVAGLAASTPAGEHHHETLAEVGTERRRWREGARALTDPLTPGPDAWRWSSGPRGGR